MIVSGWKSLNRRSVVGQSVRSPSTTPISLPEISFHASARAGSEPRIGVRESLPASVWARRRR